MTDTPWVRLTDLTKTYGDVRAVDGLSLDIAPGEVVALLGPNGAGKSTTIDLLLGLVTPDSGSVSLFGGTPRQACATGRVGAMLQSGGLLQDVTVRRLLDLLRGLYPRPLATDDVLERAGIADLASRPTTQLSGGQQQRVRFACAVLPDPDLLVLDEPTAAMDVQSRIAFWAAMRDWTASGRTVLFATHYLEEADDVADRVVLVRGGRVVADGSGAQVKALAGGRVLSATVGQPAGLDQLPGVTSAQVHGARVTLRCSDSDAALRALLAARPDAHDVEITAVGLEAAFLTLTERVVNLPYVRAEVVRTLRNTRYLVFAIGMPLVLFFVISSTDDGSTLDGLHTSPYTMVSMATFGAMSGVFSTGGRIGQERQTGWTRQLRLTSLTGRQYVLGKAVTGFAVALPSLVAVFLAAALTKGVHLSVAGWLGTGGAILLALLPVCALGIWLGYRARSDNLQAVSGGVFSLLALLGGVWVPLELFPHWVRETARDLPMAWVTQSGRDAVLGHWVGWHGAAVLAAWTLALALAAARAYDRDAARA